MKKNTNLFSTLLFLHYQCFKTVLLSSNFQTPFWFSRPQICIEELSCLFQEFSIDFQGAVLMLRTAFVFEYIVLSANT